VLSEKQGLYYIKYIQKQVYDIMKNWVETVGIYFKDTYVCDWAHDNIIDSEMWNVNYSLKIKCNF